MFGQLRHTQLVKGKDALVTAEIQQADGHLPAGLEGPQWVDAGERRAELARSAFGFAVRLGSQGLKKCGGWIGYCHLEVSW